MAKSGKGSVKREKGVVQSKLTFKPTSTAKPIECPECHFQYQKHDTKSVKYHDIYHSDLLVGLSVPKSVMQKILHQSDYMETAVINKENLNFVIIKCLDPHIVKYVQQMLDIVNKRWLNSQTSSSGWRKNPTACKVVMILSESRIVGLLTTDAGPLNGYRMDVLTATISPDKPVALQLGVSRIFVTPAYRRHKLATRMLDILRENAIYGIALKKTQVGFSQPSGIGAKMMQNWYGNAPEIPVYYEE